MTARTWPECVADVPHEDRCASHSQRPGRFPHDPEPCDCDRDARIGRGIEAVREIDGRHAGGPVSLCCTEHQHTSWTPKEFVTHFDAAAARAFAEASR